ncbi:DinB family protein [Vallicoccus soli]|uniref:DinB family protein n=1 Tax=Vallicoccus soli TaxID=2339232 RepID=A0A3A3YSH4_9ACTN|nr:DinB family protein [Vallicoccus soli]RJK92647.1 DinB family protein [Vallicoccus soli]
MTQDTATTSTSGLDQERADLLEALAHHRNLLRRALRDLDQEQATRRTTASELCLAGIVKHVAATESEWVDFILEGASSMAAPEDAAAWEAYADTFRLVGDETLEGVLRRYEEVEARTTEVLRSLPDLDASHELPEAPWFEPGARWSARRVLLHVVAETAQHAGHADIIRESLDGAKTMG